MSNKQEPDILDHLGIEKHENMISILYGSLGKSGFFRANLNGIRVNRSSRTVITPNPYLKCNQFACPLTIAKQITVPIRVNEQNLEYLYSLIQNYPNYPCVLYVNNNTRINDKNKENIVIIPGDVVYRQIMDNDIAMSNRYPSVREESFGGGIVKISNQQSIQLNMSIIEKFNADFDGDEMQLFFMASSEDNLEISLLSSVYQQFVEYTSNKNIIGGAPDLDKGIYHIKKLISKEYPQEYFIQGDIQKSLDSFISFIPEYEDDDIKIEKNKLISFNKSIADKGSQFLTWISTTYGPSFAVNIIDNILNLCYRVNEAFNFSFYYNLFNSYNKEQLQYENERIKNGSKLFEEYYTGKFESPLGVSKEKFFKSYLEAELSVNQQIQNGILEAQFTGKQFIELFNKAIIKNIEVYHKGLISIGWCDNDEGQNLTHLPRIFACYPKFSTKLEHQGYCSDNYMNGNSQTTQYLISFEGRHQAFVRGNVIAATGYMQRRVQKAFDNVYCSFNSIIIGNNGTIIELQHGQNSFDPRRFLTVKVEYNDKWDKEQKELWQYFLDLQTKCKQQGFKFEENIIQWDIPFLIPKDTEISQKELDAILQCRITENMSEEFKLIQFQQSLLFYTYCLLTLPKSKSTKYTLLKQYIQSIISPGDNIGVKSAMAVTGPQSQGTLDAIHAVKSKSGAINYVQLDKVGGPQRFLELTQAQNQFTEFSAQLLIEQDDQEEQLIKFVQKYQTLEFSKLSPIIDIYYQKKQWHMLIIIDFNTLSYNNVSLQILAEQIMEKTEAKDINLSKKTDTIEIDLIFSSIEQYRLSQFRTELLTSWKFGSNIFYNLYYQNNILHANIYQGKEQQVYLIKELDTLTIYINSIPFHSIFGINHLEHQLYNEYNINLNNMTDTKGTQQAFYQLFAAFQTQTGMYQGFNRNDYKKDNNRDFIQNIIYEEGTAFIQKAVQKQQWYKMNSFQNAEVFGVQGCSGSNISEIYLND